MLSLRSLAIRGNWEGSPKGEDMTATPGRGADFLLLPLLLQLHLEDRRGGLLGGPVARLHAPSAGTWV